MVNKVLLVGRIGADAKSKEVGDKTVSDFQIATEENWKDAKGEKKTSTEWHNIVMWGNKNLIKFLTKGTMISVVGKLKHESYAKKVGTESVTMYTTKVVADEIVLLPSGGKAKDE